MSFEFCLDAHMRSQRKIREWYEQNLIRVLEKAKENHARGMDESIELGKELKAILNEPRAKPFVVEPHNVIPSDDISMMKPVEPEVLDILFGSTEKYADVRYLKERYKKPPEDKFFFRACTSWDYGWQQKQSRLPARDVNYGRCAVLRETFYRRNNLAPDPVTYAQPSGGEFSICSQYSCYAG